MTEPTTSPDRFRPGATRWACWVLALLLTACASKSCDDGGAANEATGAVVQPRTDTHDQEQGRNKSRAVEHLPGDCLAVARIEWAALAAHPAVSPHMKAAYDPPESALASAGAEQKAFLHFLKQAKIDPTRDVTQLALCMQKTIGSEGLLVALGGDLPGEVLELMKRHAPKGEQYEIQERDGIRYLELEGQYLAQASDNAVLLAHDFEALSKAYPASEQYKTYSLPADGEIAIVARGEVVRKAAAEPIAKTPFAETLPHVQRIDGTVDLTKGHLGLAATMDSPERAQKLRGQLQQMTREMLQQAERAPASVRLIMAPNLALARKAKFVTEAANVSLFLDVPEQVVRGLMTQLLGPPPTASSSPPPSSSTATTAGPQGSPLAPAR